MVGRRDLSEYQEIIAVVNEDRALRRKRRRKRLHPAPGQQYPEEMYIECSQELRSLPVGTRVKIQVVEKNPKDEYDTKHLYSSYKWDYEIVE